MTKDLYRWYKIKWVSFFSLDQKVGPRPEKSEGNWARKYDGGTLYKEKQNVLE